MSSAIPVRLRYEVELSYQVNDAPADFIFNVQAARTRQQHVVEESLGITQPVPLQEFTDFASSGRFLRLRAMPGPVGSSRVDLQACKLEYSIVSPK